MDRLHLYIGASFLAIGSGINLFIGDFVSAKICLALAYVLVVMGLSQIKK